MKKILVVGDTMLDEYLFGTVSRVSPEAPVNVLEVTATSNKAGAAANVALNIAAMGGDVSLLSACGLDPSGEVIKEQLINNNVNALLIRSSKFSTIKKSRAMAEHHHLLRMDFEKPLPDETSKQVRLEFEKIVDDYDIVVFSDYKKGVCREIATMIRAANSKGKTCFVDPKGEDYRCYSGASLLKPNKAEYFAASRQEITEEFNDLAANEFRLKLNVESLLVTLGANGMILFSDDGVEHFEASEQQVFDVCGAGDTVIAAVAVCRAISLPIRQTIRVANIAAGEAVRKIGVGTVPKVVITDALERVGAKAFVAKLN